jgi:hypothetical protein
MPEGAADVKHLITTDGSQPASNPTDSGMSDDGITEFVFPDGSTARVPSAVIRDGLGRSFMLPELYERLGNEQTNQLLRAILRELVALRSMTEMQFELDASDLADEPLAPA